MIFSAVPKQVIDIVWDDVVKVLKPAVDTAKGVRYKRYKRLFI